MAYSEAELIPAVRAECGKVSNSIEIEDVDIQREGTFILSRIAEAIPVKVLRYITSIANTSDYDVVATTDNVRKVFQWEDTEPDMMILGGYRADEVDRDERYNFPSLWAIEQYRKMRAMPKLRFEFHPVTRKLRIMPTPSQTGNRYYYISIEHANWTLASLPAEFRELLVTGVTWKCFEIIMLKRSNLGGVLRDGGFVDFPATSLKTYVDEKKADFLDMLRCKTMIYAM